MYMCIFRLLHFNHAVSYKYDYSGKSETNILGEAEFYTISEPGTHIYLPAETSRPTLGPNQVPIRRIEVAITTNVKAVRRGS